MTFHVNENAFHESNHAALRAMVARDMMSPPRSRSAQGTPVSEKLPDDHTADVVYVCALHRPELDKVLRTRDAPWVELPHLDSDPQTYHSTSFATVRGTKLRVAAAAANQMGLAAAGVLAAKMIMKFRPKLVAMVGIAAGVKEDSQGYGDVLVAERTFDYGAGKLSEQSGQVELAPDPRPLTIHSRLLGRLKEWEMRQRHFDEIARNWQDRTPDTRLRLHIGPLGSGAAVVDTTRPLDEIRRHWRKLIGIEMEAYAVHCACRESLYPEPMFLCMKSICDFAHAKSDNWQNFAAYVSAELSYRFIVEEWESLFPTGAS